MSEVPPLSPSQIQQLRDWAESDAAQAVAQGQADCPDDIQDLICCLADAAQYDDAQGAIAIRQLFVDLVEAWNDRLDRDGRNAYAAFFPALVWRVASADQALQDRLRHYGISSQRQCYAAYAARRHRSQLPDPILPDVVERIALLSRVTIGADVLLTSVLLQRLHQAFPGAELVLIGDEKLSGLLAGLPAVRVQPIRYARRGSLAQRLSSWLHCCDAIDALDAHLILSPDSRLDQLAVLPLVMEEWSYLHWENCLNPGAPESLALALDAWARRCLALEGEEPCLPRVAFDSSYAAQAAEWRKALAGQPTLACKFDHGGNPDKALPQAREVEILQAAAQRGWRIILDAGFGEAELATSQELLAAAGLTAEEVKEGHTSTAPVQRFHGSIAGWAATLSACQAAVAYDSVGHHLAAALEVPLLSLFTGHAHPNFPVAWAPQGPGPIRQVVIPTDQRQEEQWREPIIVALDWLMSGCLDAHKDE